MEDQPHILVVDDDDRLRDLLKRYLGDNGFLVTAASDAADARARLAAMAFDLIVLDVMMPGETGLELVTDLHRTMDVPVLLLTAMGEPEDRISGLEAGADDYLSKPFDPRELVLRINSILRRVVPKTETVTESVRFGDIHYDTDREELSREGEPIRLTSFEAQMLRILVERAGEVLSREDLTRLSGAAGGERSVDVQVTRLRRKIETDPRSPRYLQTVRGRGYLLRPD
ncbi:response regulator [Magnetospira sp. QH-2]|uniref:response regulator n=1 Tax=Magnetospira sp. (strain QH-2) TaxID=1288970 RepID=UPI0003E80B3F|nr:response regulator [Magnetospira sp. QH-2]CCQ72288.1 Two-component transcriptional regulator (HTH DNA binding domain:CheY-like receiver) [Magnetospira sp. QH-2]